jgi:hypothetical protein
LRAEPAARVADALPLAGPRAESEHVEGAKRRVDESTSNPLDDRGAVNARCHTLFTVLRTVLDTARNLFII